MWHVLQNSQGKRLNTRNFIPSSGRHIGQRHFQDSRGLRTLTPVTIRVNHRRGRVRVLDSKRGGKRIFNKMMSEVSRMGMATEQLVQEPEVRRLLKNAFFVVVKFQHLFDSSEKMHIPVRKSGRSLASVENGAHKTTATNSRKKRHVDRKVNKEAACYAVYINFDFSKISQRHIWRMCFFAFMRRLEGTS